MAEDGDTLMYLIRHGSTEFNEAGVLQGRGVDPPLSALGRRQVEQTATALADLPLDAVYTSPLQRAQESAQLVAAPHALALTTIEQLVEVDVGRWEGLNWSQIRDRDGAAYQQFMELEGRCGYPEGESYREVSQRVRAAFGDLLDRHAGGHFAVVAHSVVNRTYVAHLLGMGPDAARQVSQSNGCVNVIRRRNGQTRLMTLNAALHVA